MLTIESLKNLYVKMGGSLSDTYPFAGGTVGEYTYIPHLIEACSQKYSAGGGGAEKFIVTLTRESDTWTADKTVADIIAADAANKVVVANYLETYDLPLIAAESQEGYSICVFSGIILDGGNVAVSFAGESEGGTDVWTFTETPIPTSTNAPLIVTLTESAGTITGDKTYQEVKEARLAGRPVDLVVTGYSCSSVLDVSTSTNAGTGESSISVSFIASGQLLTATGAPSDYVSKTL